MNNKRNILFICSWYPSRVLEGNGIFIQQHAEAVQIKHNVHILHIITDKHCKQDIEYSSKTINGVSTHIAYLKYTKNPITKYYRYYKAYVEIWKKLPEIDINHVNVTYPLGLIALFENIKNKIPYIITEHWSDYQFPLNKSISLIEKIITKKIISRAQFVCPVTKHLELAMKEFQLEGNYFPVPNIVNTNIFIPTSKTTDDFEIIHISNMGNECKNIIGILRVIAKLENKIPHLKFKLIGNNSEQHKEEIENLNIQNIEVIKYLEHKNLVKYLQKADLFVLFSNYENLPCVILESFACGVPVVTSNVGGIKEYFPSDFGILVEPKDEVALENAILSMYKKRNETNEKKLHNYAVENFSPEVISNSFTKLYEQAINKPV